MVIDKNLLDRVSEQAKKSPRLRMNYNFHLVSTQLSIWQYRKLGSTFADETPKSLRYDNDIGFVSRK